MDFRLNAEEQQVRDTIRDFIRREVMPLEAEVLRRERNHEKGLSGQELRDLQAKAAEAGYWGLDTPEEYGGVNLDAVLQAIIKMETSRTFVPFRFGGSADNILYGANEEQKERYLLPTINGERMSCFALTEPDAGSDATAIKMRARRDGDDWVLNGEKTFITRGTDADYAIVFAVTDPDKGADGGITCFLVDREAGWTSSPIQTMSAWEPAALSFEDVRIPADSVLGDAGYGFRLAMEWIGKGRYMIACMAVGAGERLLEMGVRYAKEREAFGHPIADYQAIQWMLADSAVELESVKWLALQAAWRVDEGLDARHVSAMAKLSGANVANRVVDRMMQVHGGMGYTREIPIERWYRELRVLRIFEGTDEIQRRTIARNLLKGYAPPGASRDAMP